MTATIHARGLRKRYGSVEALRGLDLDVDAGTVLALLGPNGAGKSTTVRILSTLARPDDGTARVGGHDVVRDPAAVRRVIGVVSQAGGADPDATVRENLELQGRIHGLRGAALRSRVDELLQTFGLTEAAKRITRTCSGGMVRRLDLALGLVQRPRVLFLDEPTTGLDPEVRAALWADIARLRREEGLTLLLTTHYLDEADRLAQRVLIVDRGAAVAEGTPDELKRGLQGDTLQIEVPAGTSPADVRAALSGVPGLRELTVQQTTASARVADGPRALPAALAALEAAGLTARSVTVARPSLDDVYLAHTGRRIADAAPARTDHPEEVAA